MEDITKVDLIFLGILYIFQVLLLWFYDYIVVFFGQEIAEFLTGVSHWPGIVDLLTNYGSMYTLIIGVYCLISGIGLIKEKSWAWGTAMVVLTFIIVQTGTAFLTSIITYDWLNASTFINFVILMVAILGIVLEKPWKQENKIFKKILVASISYEKVECDNLAKHLNIKRNELINRITDMVIKNIIDARMELPYIYFNCKKNKRLIANKKKDKKQKNQAKKKKQSNKN